MGNPSLGIETSVLFKKEGTPGTKESCAAAAMHCDLISEELDYKPVLSDYPVIAGDRQRWSYGEYVAYNDGGGSFSFRPRSAQLESLLEWIFGENAAGTWNPILLDATDLPRYTIECLKSGQNRLSLIGAKINTARFVSEETNPLIVELSVISESGDREVGGTSWISTQLDAEKPFLHSGLVFSGAEAWLDDGESSFNPEVRSLEFTCNNNLETDCYCNSTGRRIIPVGLFTLEGSMIIPYNTTTKGFWAEMIAAAKVKWTSTWTDADANTLIVAFVAKLDGELPKISGPETVWLTLNFHGVADLTDTMCITALSTE